MNCFMERYDGSIIQVGVLDGNKIFSFAHLSNMMNQEILEENHLFFDKFNSYAENSFE